MILGNDINQILEEEVRLIPSHTIDPLGETFINKNRFPSSDSYSSLVGIIESQYG